jgi:DNA-binding MarR family transcriptional regulator
MESIPSDGRPADPRRRGKLNREIKESLRELGVQLALLNHSVGSRVDLKASDLECLDLIGRHGPVSPSELARQAGVHPATMTGVLDRLERGGWITRDRDPADRRSVTVRTAAGRGAEILRLFLVDSGMNDAMDEICAQYADEDLRRVADFLRRTAQASQAAAQRLTGG